MRKILTAIFFLTIAVDSKSQVTPSDTVMNKVIIIKENNPATENRPESNRSSDYDNLIRWNLLEVGKGILSLGYERRLSDRFCLDLTLGYTIKDWIYVALDEDDGEVINYSGTFTEEIDGGTAFMIGLRIYPGDNDGFEGFYMAPQFYTKNYNATQKGDAYVYNGTTGDGYSVNYTFPMSRTENDLGLRIGWQGERGDGFFLDFNLGFASRKTTFDQIIEDRLYITATGYEQVVGYHTMEVVSNKIAFLMGFNMGVAF